MRKIFLFFAALIFCGNAFCQSGDTIAIVAPVINPKIYHVNYPVVSVIIAGGWIANYYGMARLMDKPKLSVNELRSLDTMRNSVNSFDRWGLKQKASDRPLYDNLSTYTLGGIIVAPCLLLFDKKIRKDWADLLFMYVEGHTLTLTHYCYSFLGPTYMERYRPRAYYNTEFSDATREVGNNRNSFYSGHVASAAYSTFFMAKVYCDYHPDLGGGKYLIYTAAAIPPLVLAYFRIKSLDHFPSDNAVGLMIGAVIGIVVPELHKYPCKKNLTLGMFTTPDGMGLTFRWELQNYHPLACKM